MRTGLWDRQGANIASRYKEMYGLELVLRQPVPGSEIVVESRSVIRNAKNARGLGRDRAATAPFPKSCAPTTYSI